MTTNDDSPIKLAHQIENPTGTTDHTREEVKIVAKRDRSRKRAWDQMSEIDRAVLLETVRQRRKMEAMRRSVENEVFRARSLR
ncbi:hypothetical protein [Aeromicrobium sp. CTD01-1L150]|uniref:hypothetical protein n=1 Tax=Aeromicrobium sp. CTD01-1L150 TaxID=3341830 RepID=UPI0035C1C42C